MANDWLSMQWGETLADDIDLLLRDLCIGWGYCNYSVFGDDLLRDGDGVVTASAVAQATLAAEGDPDDLRRPDIERLFVYRYGTSSVAKADYSLVSKGPYAVVPDRSDVDREGPDPLLASARALVSETAAPAVAQPSVPLDPEAVMRSIKNVRSRLGFALGAEEHGAGRQDLTTLIIVHERLTGKCWTSDPESRLRLGLGVQPGTLAGS